MPPLLSFKTIGSEPGRLYEAIRVGDVGAADWAFEVHMEHLNDVREKAVTDQRPEDVRIWELSSEAYPQIKRIRARALGVPAGGQRARRTLIPRS